MPKKTLADGTLPRTQLWELLAYTALPELLQLVWGLNNLNPLSAFGLAFWLFDPILDPIPLQLQFLATPISIIDGRPTGE